MLGKHGENPNVACEAAAKNVAAETESRLRIGTGKGEMAMNVREVEDAGHTAHQSVWESLPWYANGTLEHGEHALVERHLANCVT